MKLRKVNNGGGYIRMYLYNIEYTVKKTNRPWIAKIVGASREDVINDLVQTVGEIYIDSIYYMEQVDRITTQVKNQIVEYLLKAEQQKKTSGRPRKYELMGS